MQQTAEGLLVAPTDLGNFLGCRHLSVLDLGAARGSTKPPFRYSPMLEDLQKKGMEHEEAYRGWLRDQGLAIVDAAGPDVHAIIAEMLAGVDVIYQAALSDDRWAGRADFLRKVPTPSHLGDWSYEVYDTKLARDTPGGDDPAALRLFAPARKDPGRPSRPHARGHARPRLQVPRVSRRRLRGVLPAAGWSDGYLPRRSRNDIPGACAPLRLLRMVARLRETPTGRRSPLLRGRYIPRAD